LDLGFWICHAENAETRPVGRVTFDFSILDFGFWICHAENAETRPVGRVTFDFGFWIWDFGFATPKMQKPDR
jgi:hypothetical protein